MAKFTLGRKEKENRVCELLKEGKTVREIAAIEHLNFSEIKRIRDKYFDDVDSGLPSKRSQALKLIDNGKSDLDIAIDLDLSAKEMLEFRQEYLTLKGEDDLLRVYRAIRGDMPAFLTLYREMKIEDLSAEEAVWALTDNRTFKTMTQEYESLLKKLHPLREEVERLEKEQLELTNQNQGWGEITDVFGEGTENLLEVTDAPLIDNNWTKKVHRRRRNKNPESIENPEQGILDPTQLFGTFP
jgi:hypothetical protein